MLSQTFESYKILARKKVEAQHRLYSKTHTSLLYPYFIACDFTFIHISIQFPVENDSSSASSLTKSRPVEWSIFYEDKDADGPGSLGHVAFHISCKWREIYSYFMVVQLLWCFLAVFFKFNWVIIIFFHENILLLLAIKPPYICPNWIFAMYIFFCVSIILPICLFIPIVITFSFATWK